jgi:hypothetical protein
MSLFTGAGSTAPKENPDGLTIIKASYGITNAMQDVTNEIRNMVDNGELNFNVNAQSIGILDPAPGVKKTLQIQHKINGGQVSTTTKEDSEQVLISVPNATLKSNAAADAAKAPTLMGSIWMGTIVLLVAFLTFTSHYVGSVMFGSPALGIVFAALTLGTYGYFGLFVLPVIIFLFFLVYPTYSPTPN